MAYGAQLGCPEVAVMFDPKYIPRLPLLRSILESILISLSLPATTRRNPIVKSVPYPEAAAGEALGDAFPTCWLPAVAVDTPLGALEASPGLGAIRSVVARHFVYVLEGARGLGPPPRGGRV